VQTASDYGVTRCLRSIAAAFLEMLPQSIWLTAREERKIGADPRLELERRCGAAVKACSVPVVLLLSARRFHAKRSAKVVIGIEAVSARN